MESSVFVFHPDEIVLLDSFELPVLNPALETIACATRMHIRIDGKPFLVLMTETARSADVLDACAAGSGKACSWVPVKSLFAQDGSIPEPLARNAGRAYGLINWYSATRFCTRCGGTLEDHPSETAMRCPSCGVDYYPRLTPAIIVLVHRGDTMLLVRHAHRIQHLFSCVAGYVEHGETLEACVAREVLEETGITVKNIRYAGSQSWPFPDQYMVAFHADWASGELVPDGEEILEARWFSRSELPNIPSPYSVAWKLIMGELNG